MNLPPVVIRPVIRAEAGAFIPSDLTICTRYTDGKQSRTVLSAALLAAQSPNIATLITQQGGSDKIPVLNLKVEGDQKLYCQAVQDVFRYLTGHSISITVLNAKRIGSISKYFALTELINVSDLMEKAAEAIFKLRKAPESQIISCHARFFRILAHVNHLVPARVDVVRVILTSDDLLAESENEIFGWIANLFCTELNIPCSELLDLVNCHEVDGGILAGAIPRPLLWAFLERKLVGHETRMSRNYDTRPIVEVYREFVQAVDSLLIRQE